ncbi:MAG: SDR family NAD(P)-dependent oxidoreductase [Thermoplasmatales archaeon]
MRLTGKKAVVTGSSRGIGFEIAKAFLEEGAIVAGCGTSEDSISKAREIFKTIGKSEMFVCNVSDPKSVKEFIKKTLAFFGEKKIDILVNNAGIAITKEFVDLDLDLWEKTIGINLTGIFNVSKEIVPIMISNKNGVIINIASTNGLRGEEGLLHYNVSKGGVILFSKSLALELAKYNIRVVSVCPGLIATDILQSAYTEKALKEYLTKIPLGRFGTPRDVANACVFLASEEASFVTGSELVVDGGQIARE